MDEVRDLFWSSPRMPLLPEGEADLQRSLFEAVQDNDLQIVGDDGVERIVTKASEIGVGSTSLRLDNHSAGLTPFQGIERPRASRRP
jgi:hypothetical protein